MSHFYGSMRGNRGETTRCGDARSGLRAHVRGWDIGGRVEVWTDADGADHVIFTLTGGSNGNAPERTVAHYHLHPSGTVPEGELTHGQGHRPQGRKEEPQARAE